MFSSVSVQGTAEFSSELMDGAKFNSHDSGSHFKKSTLEAFKNGLLPKEKKFSETSLSLKLQGRFSMQSLHIDKSGGTDLERGYGDVPRS